MNALIDAAISRSRTTLSVLVLILIAGVTAFIEIPKESDPDVNVPILYVVMGHTGISPEDAEDLLIRPMEQKVRSIAGVKEMRSASSEGGGSVTLEFDAGFDSDTALDKMREQVELAKSELPEDSSDPRVYEVNLGRFPVIIITLSGPVPEQTLVTLARKLRDEIEAIPSVLEVDIRGDRDPVTEIIIEPHQLEGYGIDAVQVLQTVASSNLLVAAGTLDAGNGSFPVKVPGLYQTIEDVLDQPLKVNGDAVVTVGDVATLRQTFKDRTSYARLSGQPAIGLSVTKRSGENVIETTEWVRAVVAAATAHPDWPQGVRATLSQDKSKIIYTRLNGLQNNVMTAIILVMVVVVGALGWRSGLLVGIAIPGSFLLGIMVIWVFGMTVNMVVLFALILAVGILVDGGIVITEYADRRMVGGATRVVAYGDAAKRMSWPIISSTATTLAAFLPLMFWPGIVGQFMKFLPITLMAVLFSSLLMALIFVPTLGAMFGRIGSRDVKSAGTLMAAESGDMSRIGGFTGVYIKFLRRALRHPGKILLAAIFALFGVQGLYAFSGNGVVFFPSIETDNAVLYIHARGNLSLDEEAELVYEIEREVLKYDEFESVYTYAGSGRSGDVIGQIQLEFKDWQSRRPARVILNEIIERTRPYAGITVVSHERKPGPQPGKAIEVRMRSPSSERLVEAVERVRAKFDSMSGLINIEDTRGPPEIEWRLNVDRAQAAKFGVSVALIGRYVQLLTSGLKVTDYRPDHSEDEVDVVIRYPRAYRNLDEFENLRIQTSKGMVPISNFITWEPARKTGTIHRVAGVRELTVEADVIDTRQAGPKVKELRAWLAEPGVLPEGVEVVFEGEDKEKQEAQAFLINAFGIALFIMAIILITQFNSFYSAFLILSAVIMSTVGVVVGLMITGKPFVIVMTGIGVIALAGIVVNNNIVLIDTYDQLKKRSETVLEAILRTGAQRLRPVLLTTVTTICGLMPMALQVNIDFLSRDVTVGAPSTQWWVDLATAIVFGLGFASILTLVVTPCALMFKGNIDAWFAERRRAKELRQTRATEAAQPAE